MAFDISRQMGIDDEKGLRLPHSVEKARNETKTRIQFKKLLIAANKYKGL